MVSASEMLMAENELNSLTKPFKIILSGLSDVPGEAMVKLYCPKCMDVYNPKSSRHHHTDGAYFGSGFPHMLFMVYPEQRPKRSPNQFVPRFHFLSFFWNVGNTTFTFFTILLLANVQYLSQLKSHLFFCYLDCLVSKYTQWATKYKHKRLLPKGVAHLHDNELGRLGMFLVNLLEYLFSFLVTGQSVTQLFCNYYVLFERNL